MIIEKGFTPSIKGNNNHVILKNQNFVIVKEMKSSNSVRKALN